jgi:hypothetical protein
MKWTLMVIYLGGMGRGWEELDCEEDHMYLYIAVRNCTLLQI